MANFLFFKNNCVEDLVSAVAPWAVAEPYVIKGTNAPSFSFFEKKKNPLNAG